MYGGGCLLERLGRVLHLFAGNVHVSHCAESLRRIGVDPDAFVTQPGREGGGGSQFWVEFEDHYGRIDRSRVKGQAGGVPDCVGQNFGVLMVFGQTINVMFQGVECAGRQNAGLSPAAAERLAMPSRAANHIGRATQGGARGGP